MPRPLGAAESRPSAAHGEEDRARQRDPATQALRRAGIAFSEHVYEYLEHGGTAESARQLGVDEHAVVKTLVMQNEKGEPLIVLMHGDRQVSTKNLARAIGTKSVEPCTPEAAERASGYQVGGTSPFATRKAMPVYVEATILDLDRICINGGRRGYLVGIAPRVLTELLRGDAGLVRDLSGVRAYVSGSGKRHVLLFARSRSSPDAGG